MLDKTSTICKTFPIPHKPNTRSKSQQLRIDSMTGVNPVHSHGLGVWGNERVVFSVRVDKQLKKQFTSVSRHVFGSTCNPIESFMATIVGNYQLNQKLGVNPSITIGEIRIERNLRERRKEVGTEETDVVVEQKAKVIDVCVVCAKVAYALAFEGKDTKFLCKTHFARAKKNLVGWKVLE